MRRLVPRDLAPVLALVLLAGCAEPAPPLPAPLAAETDAAGIYAERCETCHGNSATHAPGLVAMAARNRASLRFALMNGKMRTQAEGLDFVQIEELISYISDKAESYAPGADDYCADRSISFSQLPVRQRGFDTRSTAAVTRDTASLSADNVKSLRLAWVFELPEATEARSQPVLTDDTIFVAATTAGHLFALDRETGCIKWHYQHPAPIRTALTFAVNRGQATLYLGDAEAHTSAIDAATGKPRWRRSLALSDFAIQTGGIVYDRGTLVVPLSLYEVALAQDPAHECCQAHGAVYKLDADTGETIWLTHMTDDAKPTTISSAGTQQWGPSGVPVWSTPTIDTRRNRVYVGTGQNASPPATDLSDAVVALDLDTGSIAWHFQATAGDVFNNACVMSPKGPNCPRYSGPDVDFGAAIILGKNSRGQDVLLAGAKSGDVFALDPDRNGEVVWRARVGTGSPLGGVHWGMAVAHNLLFAGANDPPYRIPGYAPAPGLSALDIDTGKRRWHFEPEQDCEIGMMDYFQRDTLYPECSFFYGFSAAVTVVNDLVFAPALDGRIRVFHALQGNLLWEFDTARPFKTTSGREAHGGSMDNAGVVFAGNQAFMLSGYELFGQLPGNLLLAFVHD
ncbi:MAG: PQQ-binding-like beta-propeller repeat protein [Pseudomonadota bacterium]